MDENRKSKPYRSTPVFTEKTLPEALRREHRVKDGVWGVVRMLEGKAKLHFVEPRETHVLAPGAPRLLPPNMLHYVEILGPMRMQIDFYDHEPEL